MNNKYILASKSPRRKELLKLIIPKFDTFNSNLDETKITDEILKIENISFDSKFNKIVKSLAFEKANSVFKNQKKSIVIGSDTIVTCDNIIFGKPKDKKDAKRMLIELCGKTHKVITGVAVLSENKKIIFHSKSYVKFYDCNEIILSQIEKYVDSGVPLDKAGAYGIQDDGAFLIKHFSGDFYSIMGLPISRLRYELVKNNLL